MDEEPLSGFAAGAQREPLDIMRSYLVEREYVFEEDSGFLHLRMTLDNCQCDLFCAGEAGSQIQVVVGLPVRARKEIRAAVGEFLHRLNFGQDRKFWEFDYSDGEIRLSAYSDLFNCELTAELFGCICQTLLSLADITFPYLSGVLSGVYNPEFAADQALAAIQDRSQHHEDDYRDEYDGDDEKA